ncbi:hypothetical protein GGF43_003268 [Coemansia sp. RSA 2618]|nr:hypothetical protein GGF43_003268 [Coemansia sp. RSA 2618]
MDAVFELFRPLNLCIGFSAYAAWRVIHALYLSPLRNVPGPFWARVSALPMFYYDIRGQEPEFMQRCCAKYGSVFVMEPDKVGVCGYKESTMILNSHGFLKDERYTRVKFIEPNMFLTRDPELNRQRRRQIGGALSPVGLRAMEPAILGAGVEQLMRKWDAQIDGAELGCARVEYFGDFSDMSFDVICSLGFGVEHRSLTTQDRRISTWVRNATRLMFVQIVVPVLSCTPFRQTVLASLHRSVDRFLEFGKAAIEQRKREMQGPGRSSGLLQGPGRRRDLLQAFIDAEDPGSKAQMTAEQITSETVINMLAGTDTTANTLTWCVHLLLLHPRCLARCVDEVRAAFARDHVIRHDEARSKLVFLEACVYEALRLRPAPNNLPRSVLRGGVVLRKHFIPDTCTLSVSIAACNTNPELWTRPHEFYPERFVEDAERKRHVLTFSAGVRVCPGRYLAWWEVITTLANVLNRYELELPEDARFSPRNTDASGVPVIMPHNQAITCSPRYPDRDCIVLVSKRS